MPGEKNRTRDARRPARTMQDTWPGRTFTTSATRGESWHAKRTSWTLCSASRRALTSRQSGCRNCRCHGPWQRPADRKSSTWSRTREVPQISAQSPRCPSSPHPSTCSTRVGTARAQGYKGQRQSGETSHGPHQRGQAKLAAFMTRARSHTHDPPRWSACRSLSGLWHRQAPCETCSVQTS